MPNWCFNTLEVRGDYKELQNFKNFIRGSEKDNETGKVYENVFSFQQVIPMPEELNITSAYLPDDKSKWSDEDKELAKKYASNKKKYGAKDWYEWRRNHWDTKWNSCDATITEDIFPIHFDEKGKKLECGICYQFDTAWSFPAAIAVKVSSMFPNLQFEWSANEESGEFDFTVIFEKGYPIHYEEFEENEDGQRFSTEKPVTEFMSTQQIEERLKL